ncbi:hypothetical protein [Rhodococcus qingshengii]|uniref:hypothetical protein n=1 Tax=Rhodococcus qingshengii TaxID=334542 RepID=UPI00301611C8
MAPPYEDVDEPFYEGQIDETIFDETWRVLSQWFAMDRVCPINGVWGPAVFISGWFFRTVRRR